MTDPQKPLKKLDVPVNQIPDGTEFIMTSPQFNNVKNKVVKLCGKEAIHPNDPTWANWPLAYFTYVDRPDRVTRAQFIRGMQELPGGRTVGGWCIWQHEIDMGTTILEYI